VSVASSDFPFTILQVVPELGTGGAERTTLEVAAAVMAAGGRAIIWSAGGRLVPELEALGAVHYQGQAKSKNPWQMFVTNSAELRGIIVREKVDLVHARSRAPAWSALTAAKQSRVKFVTTYHGIYSAKSALKRWYNSVMVRSDAVIANSNFTKAHLIAQHATAAEKVTVIYRGVDIKGFDRHNIDPQKRVELAKKWNLQWPPTRPRLILPGRLTEWKGQKVFITALATLKAEGYDFEAILVGDSQGRDGYVDQLHNQIKTLNLHGQVFMVGHCDDMPTAFSLCDMAVTPSTQPEAFGRTAAEAQAMGLPVIASDLGGARETVDPGVTGLLSPPGDALALAANLAAILKMPIDQQKAMGAAGCMRVRALFTTESLQRDTLALYQRLLRSKA
jgi:glycosyltransferase involved in cell wall biosynthesis